MLSSCVENTTKSAVFRRFVLIPSPLFPEARLFAPILAATGRFHPGKRRDGTMTTTAAMAPECPVCAGSLDAPADPMLGELLDCDDCGSEMEVTSLSPLQLAEAPIAAEDWGE
jgi:alpha-aminoadipate carrier protein LysW